MYADAVRTPEDTDKDWFTLYQGDSRELTDILSQFPDELLAGNLVDTVITSPPYADLKNYGYDKEVQVGVNESYESYLDTLRDIFKQTYQITRESGTLWVVANTFKKENQLQQLPFDIADVCQNLNGLRHCDNCSEKEITVPLTKDYETGQFYCENCGTKAGETGDSWILQDIVIWDKGRALPYAKKGRLRNVFEYILCFSKSSDFNFDVDKIRVPDLTKFKQWWVNYPERYHPRGKLPDNIWEMMTPTQGSWGGKSLDHPAPFPQELVERILYLTTDEGDVVFDPFAGSGMVLAQAEAMSRTPLGIEANEEYYNNYEYLREEIVSEWENETERGETTQKKQRELEQLIGSLRQTRQARELIRIFAKENNLKKPAELPISAVFHICGEIKNVTEVGHPFIDSEYIIVAEESDRWTLQELETELKTQLAEPPCSKFGVDAGLTVKSISDFVANIQREKLKWLSEQLFIYTEGQHNDYEETTDIKSLIEGIKSGWDDEYNVSQYPPIISNRGLSVPTPKRGDGPVLSNSDIAKVESGTIDGETNTLTFQLPKSAD